MTEEQKQDWIEILEVRLSDEISEILEGRFTIIGKNFDEEAVLIVKRTIMPIFDTILDSKLSALIQIGDEMLKQYNKIPTNAVNVGKVMVITDYQQKIRELL